MMVTQWQSISKETFSHGELGNRLNQSDCMISACGQLGLASMKDLPTDVEGYPY